MRMESGHPFPKCVHNWASVPLYPFNIQGEQPGMLASKWVVVFFTANVYTQTLKNTATLQYQGASGSDIKTGGKFSFNLAGLGVLL